MKRYACAILLRGEKMLLGMRAGCRRANPNCWGVIGGNVEAGEAVDVALWRELREATGHSPLR
jgi:ADP-ribose pyrophosphatase YjhB (NUDIX family)